MDSLRLCWIALVGCCSFALPNVLPFLADRPERGGARAGSDPIGEVLERLRHIPAVRRVEERASDLRGRAECLKQMPVMLDVVTLGLSAGLSFDSSLELYCHRYDNGLARGLAAAMLSWQLGTTGREEALNAMARRLGVSSLERFASVVSQSLAFGSPLAATLEQQAQAIRDEQRAQMEEEIERVPVKMLIPLGTLIVPAMLMAILGPLLGASMEIG